MRIKTGKADVVTANGGVDSVSTTISASTTINCGANAIPNLHLGTVSTVSSGSRAVTVCPPMPFGRAAWRAGIVTAKGGD